MNDLKFPAAPAALSPSVKRTSTPRRSLADYGRRPDTVELGRILGEGEDKEGVSAFSSSI